MDNLRQLLSQPWINLRQLEIAAGIPRGTLEHFTSGRRKLPRKYEKIILKILSKPE